MLVNSAYRHFTLPVGWSAFILLLTLLPGNSLPSLSVWDAFRIDKAAHFGVFAIDSLLVTVALLKVNTKQSLAILLAFGFTAALGLAIEFGQMLVPNRSFEYADFLADSIGGALGILLFFLIYKL